MSEPSCNQCGQRMILAGGVSGHALWRCVCGREIPAELAAPRERLLEVLAARVAAVRLVEAGAALIGWTVRSERSHAAAKALACDALDLCEAAGIPEHELLPILNQGASGAHPS